MYVYIYIYIYIGFFVFNPKLFGQQFDPLSDCGSSAIA